MKKQAFARGLEILDEQNRTITAKINCLSTKNNNLVFDKMRVLIFAETFCFVCLQCSILGVLVSLTDETDWFFINYQRSSINNYSPKTVRYYSQANSTKSFYLLCATWYQFSIRTPTFALSFFCSPSYPSPWKYFAWAGQIWIHAPQRIQVLGSISFGFIWLIAWTGQRFTQRLQ